MTKVKIISISTILLYSVALTVIMAYLVYYTQFTEWLALISLFLSVGLLIVNILNAIAKMLRQPRLKIIESRIETQRKDSEGEYKDVYFVVRNVGDDQASDCTIKAKVKDVWKDFYNIAGVPFSLNAGDDRGIHFQRIFKSDQRVLPLTENRPIFDRGKVYECEIKFYGRNFKDEKHHHIRLNLSSWENIGITFDC